MAHQKEAKEFDGNQRHQPRNNARRKERRMGWNKRLKTVSSWRNKEGNDGAPTGATDGMTLQDKKR